MEKDNRLINIYIKIHNKKTITMDDLQYLAYYDPECFRKTCKNVVYNIPEAEVVMAPVPEAEVSGVVTNPAESVADGFSAQAILDHLRLLEADSSVHAEVDAVRVKNLLGNLFMELLFPHNDKEAFIGMAEEEMITPSFDMKA